MRELADKDLADAKSDVDEKRDLLSQARRDRENGDAYNILAAQNALKDAQSLQKKKETAQRQALKREQALQSIQQAGNLITASSSIIKATGGIPLLYLPILGIMWATFLKTRADAFSQSRQFSGGGQDVIGGGSHASGNDTFIGKGKDGKENRAQKGERWAIFSDKAESHYGSSLENWIDEINARKFDLTPQYKSNSTIVNVNTSRMERSLNTLVKQGVNSSEIINGKRVTVIGNVTTIYR